MIAAGNGGVETVKALLDGGADVFAVDGHAGCSALHKACQGGKIEIVKMLLDKGAFVDWSAVTTGHTPLMDALWFKYADIVDCLLASNAGLKMYAHYGFSLQEHFDYELKVNERDRASLLKIDAMLKARKNSDQKKVEDQKLMAAVVKNDLAAVKKLLKAGANVDERSPMLNGFNDGHTPLIVAARDGHTEIVAELLKAGADVNAMEPTFMSVPLHKAAYNGRIDIMKLLVKHPGIKLDFQGGTNGYTPLHDALWHGFHECAGALIEAGARVDLRGHDGKTALDMAKAVLGPKHATTKMIAEKMKAR
jgi:ankyrin repeat protein